jgi:hypothetical protein
MKSSFIIVADRGNLKAYRIEKVPNGRPPRLQLVEALSLTDAHMRISEVNTDLAGRYPAGGGGQSIAEQHVDIEIDKRIVKQLAEHISSILKQEQPVTWSFAAPAMINRAVLNVLEPSLTRCLASNLQSDLVNIEPSDLLEHFEAARAA